MNAFDLRHREWVDARLTTGEPFPTGLVPLLENAHGISGIEVPVPPAYAGIRHILTALAYRITGLDRQEGAKEWRDRRDRWLERGSFTSAPTGLGSADPHSPSSPVRDYFDRVPAERFDLFGERPFLQDPRLRTESDTCGINKLVLGRPTGINGATWWTRHHQGRQDAISAKDAVWWLIVQWFYGAAGQITPRAVNGTKSSSSKAGMLRNTITYYPRGRTLFESLMLALVPPEAARPDPGTGPGPDLCPWEWEELPDPDAAPRLPGGMCALLTGVHAHSILLVPDEDEVVHDVYRTWAYRKPWPERRKENPFVSYERSKGFQRTPDPARALWRELDSLLPVSAAGETGRTVAGGRFRPPRFLEERQNIGPSTSVGMTAVGFSQDPMTTDHAWWTSTAPPEFIRLLDDEAAVETASATRRALDLLAGDAALLNKRLRSAWRNGVRASPKAKTNNVWPTRAAPLFWERAEAVFYARLETELSADPDSADAERNATARAVRTLCVGVYNEVTRSALAHGDSAFPPTRQDFHLRKAVFTYRPPFLPSASEEHHDDRRP